MIADQLQARDEMMKLFNDGWNAADWSRIGGTKPEVRFQGREKNTAPAVDKPYARVQIQHASGDQAAFVGEGKRMVCKTGIVTVQSFGHLSSGEGLEIATAMAIIAERCFSGKTSPNGVWFRRIRSNEIGPTGGWYQVNTIIDFEYNELR